MARRAGLHAEILLTLSIMFGAALLLGGLLFLRFTEQSLINLRARQSIGSARLLGAMVGQRLSNREFDSALDLPLIHRMQREIGIGSWWLYNQQLTLVASFNQGETQPFALSESRQLANEKDYLIKIDSPGLLGALFQKHEGRIAIVVPLENDQGRLGVFQAGFSLQGVYDELWQVQRWVFLYALGYGLVLVGFGLLLLHKNVVHPVKKLLLATQMVSSGDLDGRLDVYGPREIARLGSEFNGMIEALKASRAETETHIQSLQEANRELRETQEQLVRSETMASVGYLAAGMAHEVGNPLGAITGYLGWLRDDLPPGKNREVVELAAKEADRIDQLVKDLLDYAAPPRQNAETFDPGEVVRNAKDLLAHQGAFKELNINDRLPDELPEVRMVRHRLLQVLINLLLNARDACRSGGRVDLTALVEGSSVLISVEDDGEGMDAETRKRIFEPFFTTKDPGKGRGLGLAVCQRFIAEAGGRIEVVSRSGVGSRFVLCLPCAEEETR